MMNADGDVVVRGMDLTPGIVLDRSHASALDLDLAIIDYAMEVVDYELDGEFPYDANSMDDGDYVEAIRYYADGAVDYMNSRVSGIVFVVEDNSLFIESVDGA
jgi:hypothetical protein